MRLTSIQIGMTVRVVGRNRFGTVVDVVGSSVAFKDGKVFAAGDDSEVVVRMDDTGYIRRWFANELVKA